MLLFVSGEVGNGVYHTSLARLRSLPSKATDDTVVVSASGHRIPHGGLFSLVSMPHYLCELVAFIGFALVAPTLASALFWLGSVLNLVPRALEAHQKYHDEFGKDYPQQRKALVPWLL